MSAPRPIELSEPNPSMKPENQNSLHVLDKGGFRENRLDDQRVCRNSRGPFRPGIEHQRFSARLVLAMRDAYWVKFREVYVSCVISELFFQIFVC